MNRLFLSAAALFIILSNVLPYSINDAEAKTAVKRKIHAEGEGVPASTSNDAPLDVRKQEAFVAAFFVGVRNIAEQALAPKSLALKESGDMIIVSFLKRIGNFGVNSATVIKIKEAPLSEDRISVNYKGQKIVIKDVILILPAAKFVKLPRWDRLPKKISGIEVKDAKLDDKEETFTVKLAYRYVPTKTLALSKRFDGLIIDASDTEFRPALINRIFTSWGDLIYDPGKMISHDVLVQSGCGEYNDSLEKVRAQLLSRGVKNPLVIKAKEIMSDNKDIVISEKDASKILKSDNYAGFLDEAKVGFVVKQQIQP